jgi:phenylalanyl-tRNA synthetase beta chain
MKFTLAWLKEHLETEATLAEIVDKLSMIGLEVESVEDDAAALAPFTVAYVKEARRHPNADRLSVCLVDTGSEEVQVVCGAPNARSGMYGVFAPNGGAYIPGTDITLKAGVIRGEASNGMLVSEREMGLSDEHEGIIDLSRDDGEAPAPLGTPFAGLLGLDDPVIDIAITPNRSDCLGVRGVARDLAAAGLGRLKPLVAPLVDGSFDSPLAWRRDLPEDRQDACPYVAGRYFRGVRNGPSPKWMQRRLRAIGLRPISALVDITNFVTFDLGRPLHVFDADKVEGDPTMRFARDGERILALDEKIYVLDEDCLVIADENGPEGIGGLMGGEHSGCTETTTNVFLEVALFDPIMVAETGRRLGILSDARYRFERGLDPESARWGVEVAARLIQETCGGEVSHVVSAGSIPEVSRSLSLRDDRVETLGGVAVPLAEQSEILTTLGFGVEAADGRLVCAVPSWRPDIETEACLVEEVLRIHGFEHLPQTVLTLDTTLPLPALSLRQRRVSAARTALCWSGLSEAITFSFVSERAARLKGGPAVRLERRGAAPRQPDLQRSRRHAPLGAAAADRGRGPQRRPRLPRRLPVRGRPRLRGCGDRRSAPGRRRPALWPQRAAPLADAAARGRSLRCQGRCAQGLGGLRRAGRQPAGHGGRAELVPPRSLGRAAPRAQPAGQLRRAAPEGAAHPRPQGPHPRAQGQEGPGRGQAASGAEAVAPDAGRARFRLRRRRGGAGRQGAARHQGRRQGAGRRGRPVRRLPRCRHRPGQEVARLRGHPAPERAHADRRRPGSRQPQDHCPGRQGHRRRAARVDLFLS